MKIRTRNYLSPDLFYGAVSVFLPCDRCLARKWGFFLAVGCFCLCLAKKSGFFLAVGCFCLCLAKKSGLFLAAGLSGVLASSTYT